MIIFPGVLSSGTFISNENHVLFDQVFTSIYLLVLILDLENVNFIELCNLTCQYVEAKSNIVYFETSNVLLKFKCIFFFILGTSDL